ncbi:MAG: CBM21 domain-containing protein [Lachnospiraceae bacterium]|nr:CBM21 domain-containing protein [Lachnospiraceae bacterium]MDE6232798.1 CBM21 domain-containing protein [Lachnospiraceae bacterium]MDE6252326.1 CBM21 domain-containing protein [Lachnospiraceae bacterium]
MNISKNIKKVTAIILALAMMFGVFGISGMEVTVKAADNPVKMYYCDQGYSYYGTITKNVYIQIDSRSASNKQVYIHHTNYEGTDWEDTEATYFTKLDDNTEIWKASICGIEAKLKYAIKYIGDGKTYWDNNNGNNYGYDITGAANVKAGRLVFGSNSAGVNVTAVVKNIAYDKKVKVRYTLDNGKTYEEKSLSYSKGIEGTNDEIWSTDISFGDSDYKDFHFCISYEVNGKTYWDNNFGANFDYSYSKGR